jgi:hypothetical protein
MECREVGTGLKVLKVLRPASNHETTSNSVNEELLSGTTSAEQDELEAARAMCELEEAQINIPLRDLLEHIRIQMSVNDSEIEELARALHESQGLANEQESSCLLEKQPQQQQADVSCLSVREEKERAAPTNGTLPQYNIGCQVAKAEAAKKAEERGKKEHQHVAAAAVIVIALEATEMEAAKNEAEERQRQEDERKRQVEEQRRLEHKVTFHAIHDSAPENAAMYLTGSFAGLVGCEKCTQNEPRPERLLGSGHLDYIPEEAEFLYLLLQEQNKTSCCWRLCSALLF